MPSAALFLSENPSTHLAGGWVPPEPFWTFWGRAKSLAAASVQTLY